MAHLPQRWLGIILREVRGHYPDARLAAWGPLVEGHGDTRMRLEITMIDPIDPDSGAVAAIRAALVTSDLPVQVDLRPLADLSVAEQDEVLDRGMFFGG